jgi:hypothetical protein
LARPKGFEPLTSAFGGEQSRCFPVLPQWSELKASANHGNENTKGNQLLKLVEPIGIEPTTS